MQHDGPELQIYADERGEEDGERMDRPGRLTTARGVRRIWRGGMRTRERRQRGDVLELAAEDPCGLFGGAVGERGAVADIADEGRVLAAGGGEVG